MPCQISPPPHRIQNQKVTTGPSTSMHPRTATLHGSSPLTTRHLNLVASPPPLIRALLYQTRPSSRRFGLSSHRSTRRTSPSMDPVRPLLIHTEGLVPVDPSTSGIFGVRCCWRLCSTSLPLPPRSAGRRETMMREERAEGSREE